MPTPDSPAVYQLRIRLDRISPLIWRRLLVTDATTIAELHAIIQIAFGWSDSHLHQFIIHGKPYGIAYLGGVSFADNPDQIRLADFHFRTSERFYYEYNFHVPWRHEIITDSITKHPRTAITMRRLMPAIRHFMVKYHFHIASLNELGSCRLRGEGDHHGA